MPVFKIMVEAVIRITTEIVVEADDLTVALEYTRNNNEWYRETDNCLNEVQRYETKIPVAGRQIASISELPKNYDGNSVPWNSKTSKDLDKLLSPTYPAILDKRIIDVFDLSARPLIALSKVGIIYVGQLVKLTESELFNIKNIGRKTRKDLRHKLHKFELNFSMNFDWTIPK